MTKSAAYGNCMATALTIYNLFRRIAHIAKAKLAALDNFCQRRARIHHHRNSRPMKTFTLTIVIALLSGCASLPSTEQAESADYGSYPDNYESVVKAYYARVLKDPESIRYGNITSPQKYWLGSRFEGARYGYLVCASVNAKNSYGGYVGSRTDGLLIRNGSVILPVETGNWFGRQIC